MTNWQDPTSSSSGVPEITPVPEAIEAQPQVVPARKTHRAVNAPLFALTVQA